MGRTEEDDEFFFARLIHLGVTVLGYPERDVWRMTPRKLVLLHRAHREYFYPSNRNDSRSVDKLSVPLINGLAGGEYLGE